MSHSTWFAKVKNHEDLWHSLKHFRVRVNPLEMLEFSLLEVGDSSPTRVEQASGSRSALRDAEVMPMCCHSFTGKGLADSSGTPLLTVAHRRLPAAAEATIDCIIQMNVLRSWTGSFSNVSGRDWTPYHTTFDSLSTIHLLSCRLVRCHCSTITDRQPRAVMDGSATQNRGGLGIGKQRPQATFAAAQQLQPLETQLYSARQALLYG